MQGSVMRGGILATIAVFVAVACGSGGGATSAPATPAPGSSSVPGGVPTGIDGNVDIHGSSTVAPISNAVAEDLADANPEFSYVVGDEGTGAGFADFFCVDGSDIADASRPIRASDPSDDDDEEADVCAANGVEYVELKVAYDGIAVITHVDNPVTCLTFADLYALMGPEADGVANWNDAETVAHELGSTTDLPDAPLSITAPGDESGTYDSFIELVMLDLIEERFPDDPESAEHLRTPGDVYVASPNDNVIIQGISGFETSLGFVGLSYAEENAATVKMLEVDNGDGCVAPTIDTVADGSYPISRPLFIYPNLGRAASNPALVAYVDYYLSDAGISNAAEVGYVPLPADELQATVDAWEAAKP
jgi:phosphate transport system substrate-binding protein